MATTGVKAPLSTTQRGLAPLGFRKRPPGAACEGHSPHDGQPGDGEHEGRLVVVNHVLGQVPGSPGPWRRRQGAGVTTARRGLGGRPHGPHTWTRGGRRLHEPAPQRPSSPLASPSFPPPDPLLDRSGEHERGARPGGWWGAACHPTPQSKGAALSQQQPLRSSNRSPAFTCLQGYRAGVPARVGKHAPACSKPKASCRLTDC